MVKAKKFMVAMANPYASETGMRILEKGGTAIDAAIVVQMVLNLVEPDYLYYADICDNHNIL